MAHKDELRIKFNIDKSISSCYYLIYSYAKGSEAPIVFSHYAHDHDLPTPISYPKNNKYCTLFVIMSGKLSFVFDNSVYNPSYGNALVIRNYEKYTACFYANSYLDYYEINFPIEFFEKIPEQNPFYDIFYKRKEGEHNMAVLDSLNCENMINKLRKIEKLVNSKNKYADMMAYSYIMQIMDIINTRYCDNPDTLPLIKIPQKLKKAIDYIHLNFTTIESMDDVADHCEITATYLARMFKNSLFCTPNEYITNLRISNAKYLLDKGHSLTEACFKSGFNNYTYFITKFKSLTGITPAKFKKETKD